MVDTVCASYLASTERTSGAAASSAENRKRAKYEALAERYIFVPLGFETYGSWGEEALDFIKSVGRKIALKTGDARSTSFLFQRISIAIQRGNAASFLCTFPRNQGLNEIFYILCWN